MEDPKELAAKFAKAAQELSFRRARVHDHNTPPDQRYNTLTHMAQDFMQLAPELLMWASEELQHRLPATLDAATIEVGVKLDEAASLQAMLNRTVLAPPSPPRGTVPETLEEAYKRMMKERNDLRAERDALLLQNQELFKETIKLRLDVSRALAMQEAIAKDRAESDKREQAAKKEAAVLRVDNQQLTQRTSQLRAEREAAQKQIEDLTNRVGLAEADAETAANNSSAYWRVEYMKLHAAVTDDAEFHGTQYALGCAKIQAGASRRQIADNRATATFLSRFNGWTFRRNSDGSYTIEKLGAFNYVVPAEVNGRGSRALLHALCDALIGENESVSFSLSNI